MSEKKASLFRKKAPDEIRSPEQLNDYLRVTNPGIWVILAAVILLFAGLFACSAVGRLETTADAVALVEDGTARVYLTDAAASPITSGMEVRIRDQDYGISTVERDEYGRAVALAPVPLANGTYDAKIILETVSPISFLIR